MPLTEQEAEKWKIQVLSDVWSKLLPLLVKGYGKVEIIIVDEKTVDVIQQNRTRHKH
jgi:hypothetical protein